MRLKLLSGVLLMLVSACSFGQFGHSNNDAVETEDDPLSELIDPLSLPSNGKVAGFISNSRFRYVATIKDSKFDGQWNSWFANETLRDEGKLKKGIPDGTWKVWRPDGKLQFERTFSWDKYHRITGQFARPHPKLPNYSLTELYKKDRKKALAFTRYHYSFKKNESDYVPVFTNCLLHGLYVNYHSDGSVKDSGHYENGLRSGVWIESSNDANEVLQGSYKNSQRTGTWKLMNKQNQVLALIFYKNGKEDWRKVFKQH